MIENKANRSQPEARTLIQFTRREVLRQAVRAAGGATALAAAVAACGGSGVESRSGASPATTSAAPQGLAGKRLASTADVPVGDGKILEDDHVVLTQPSQGSFKAFSSTCTHRGCTVGEVASGSIRCPCHGSVFSAQNGSVKNGPATSPLPQYRVRVIGTMLTLA